MGGQRRRAKPRMQTYVYAYMHTHGIENLARNMRVCAYHKMGYPDIGYFRFLPDCFQNSSYPA